MKIESYNWPASALRFLGRLVFRHGPTLDERMANNRLPYLRTTSKDLFQRKAAASYQRTTGPRRSSGNWSRFLDGED